MKYGLAALLASAALAACSGNVQQRELTPDLFADREELASITRHLEPADRKYFTQYAMSRAIMMLGEPITMPNGKDPATVDDAIKLMKAREVRSAEVAKLLAERRSKMDAIVAERNRIGMSDPKAYNAHIDLESSTHRHYEARLGALKAKPLELK